MSFWEKVKFLNKKRLKACKLLNICTDKSKTTQITKTLLMSLEKKTCNGFTDYQADQRCGKPPK